jgi:GH18 family chitinase
MKTTPSENRLEVATLADTPAATIIFGFFETRKANRENCSFLKPDARGWSYLRQLSGSLFGRVAYPGIFCLLVTFACLQTEAQTMTLNSPNAGATWQIGTSQTVSWSVSGDTSHISYFVVRLSINNGSSYTDISANLSAATRSFNYTPTSGQATTTAVVWVRAFNSSGTFLAGAISSGPFTIIAASSPALTVTAPNGGETWALGVAHTITWSVTGDTSQINNFLVSYSLDGGSTYLNDVGTATAASLSISWTPPLVISPTAVGRIRVQARNASNSVLSQDVSDGTFTFGSSTTGTTRVVGYFPEYEYSRFSSIDLSALTQINYFSISGNADGTLSTANINTSHLDAVVAAAHNNSDKVSITLDWSTPFIAIAQNPTALANFVNNLVQFCNTHVLDGVDLDWEPTNPTTSDINSFGVLIDALHTQTSSRGLLLSAAVNAINHIIPQSVIADLDWVAVMDYDLQLGDHANYDLSVQFLNGWATYGVPKAKLLMGVPFYGQDGQGYGGTHTLSYRTIVNDTHPASNLDQVYDPIDATTWFYNGIATIQRKANYVLDNGFGGLMIWELGQDHFDAFGNYDQWSLLPAIKSVVGATDTTSPTVSISSPTSGQTFTASPVTVSGTATDPGSPSTGVSLVQMQVNGTGGTWQTASGTTSWSAAAALSSGANTIYVRSQDGAGNYSTVASVNVTYNPPDTTPPTVSISSPTAGQTFTTSPVPVSGTATDPGSPSSGVSLVQVQMNGTGGTWQTASGTTSWSASATLSSGANTIYVRSQDGAGNYSTVASVNVTYTPDTQGPALTITSPANNAVMTNASLPVSGTASDNGYGNNGISSVTVNGVSASGGTASGSGTANWSATITLNAGANTITVVAKDTLNNSTQKVVSVTYNPPRPIFASSSVSGGQLRTTLSGLSVGENIVFYVSSDLINWTPLRTNSVLTGSTLTFTNTINPAMKNQFFRARVQ